MNSKKWIKVFVALSFLGVVFVGGVNFVVDPYGYNNLVLIEKINKNKNSNTSMTTRYKSNILTNGNFNVIMLGTSRIGVMDPSIVKNYLNLETFNLEYPGSNAEIHNKFFKYANHFNEVKYLIYGIDFMAFNENRIIKNDFKEFYDLQNKLENFEKISNYELYFNLNTFVATTKLVIKNIFGLQKIVPTYLVTNGMRDYKNYIEDLKNKKLKLDNNIELSIKSYFKRDGIYKNYTLSSDYVNDFKNTLEYCKANNIKVFVYIPPMYSDHYDAIAKAGYFEQYELFQKELVGITNYIDFTGHNTISKNKNNYWDSSHLRKEITSVIMAKIFNDESVDIPKDFGILVTKQNINQHLENLREQIQNYDLNKTLDER